MYLISLGRPTDIGLQLSKACYPCSRYEGESISNQPNLFPVGIHLFFFDVIVL